MHVDDELLLELKDLSVSISCFILYKSMFSRPIPKNCLYGININEGPLFFASTVIKDKFDDVTQEIKQRLEILNGILYHVCSVADSQEDIVKTRINDGLLESKLKEKFDQSSSIWSSFLVVNNTKTFYRSSCVVKFNNEDDDNTQQCTNIITDFARSSGIPLFISKFVPTVGKLGYTVRVISCESESCEEIDPFEILPVKYIGHHPLFEYGHSIFKSFKETQNILNLADRHLNKPEINELKDIANARKISRIIDPYPNPFIVVEGLDGVGKPVEQSSI